MADNKANRAVQSLHVNASLKLILMINLLKVLFYVVE